MSDDRPWYREPETFIALAALVVSVTAVVVGIYEAHLQRVHDRAEVWPRLELGTFETPKNVAVILQNTGLGPAIVKSIVVTVDGKPMHNWEEALTALFGRAASPDENYTAANSAIRGGDKLTLIGLEQSHVPAPGFLQLGPRMVIRICYASVFDDDWQLTVPIGGVDVWQPVQRCDAQPQGVYF